MLDSEEVAIRNYDSKKGKFLVLIHDKEGFHIECKSNPLAKIPLLGRLVKWYYEKKLPAVVQYLLSDMSRFDGVLISELRQKVKATIDRFFASRAHNQSPLHQRCFEAYDRAFPKPKPIRGPLDQPAPQAEPFFFREPKNQAFSPKDPEPKPMKAPEQQPEPVIIAKAPEPQQEPVFVTKKPEPEPKKSSEQQHKPVIIAKAPEPKQEPVFVTKNPEPEPKKSPEQQQKPVVIAKAPEPKQEPVIVTKKPEPKPKKSSEQQQKPVVIAKAPEQQPEPVIIAKAPEVKHAPVSIPTTADIPHEPAVEIPVKAPEGKLTHVQWVKKFEEEHCVLERNVRELLPIGLNIDAGFAAEMQKLLARLPNLHFYFTMPLGSRPDPNRETFKQAVKNGPENALWVQVSAFRGQCPSYGPASFEILPGQHIFSLYLGFVRYGLGFANDKINPDSFKKFIANTMNDKMLKEVAASTKAIRDMESFKILGELVLM